MRWLRSRSARDDGATIVIIAAAMLALVGLVGLAIDAGAVFAERRELSRGADAAALAIAETCALGESECTVTGAWAMADEYADANADDGAASIFDVDLDLTAQKVGVTTLASDAFDGADEFKLFFMRALGFDAIQISAYAEAEWGYAAAATALPLIISDCEYERYAPETGDSPIVTLFFHQGNDLDACSARAGQDTDGDGILPGGFGWVITEGDCSAEITSENWVIEDPGASASRGCGPSDLYDLLYDRTVAFPYFDDVWGLGSNGTYHISGVGAFHITGYNFGGQYKAPSASAAPCSGDDRCIAGYFTTDVIYEGPIGGEDRGLIVVRFSG